MHERGFARPGSLVWAQRGLSAAVLALAPACGFIGFDPYLQRDGGKGGDERPDAAPDRDGGHEPADAGHQPMDAGHSDRDAALASMDAAAIADAAPGEDAAPEASVPDPPATQVSDYCVSVPKLQRDPVIDGIVDSHLNVVNLAPVGWSSSTPGMPLPTHTTASYAVAWLPDGLYVYIRVVDPNRIPPDPSMFLWQGDGVELYFDSDGLFPALPAYDNPGTVQIIVAAPGDASAPSTRSMRFRDGNTLTPWMSSRFATFPTADGYAFEGLLQADAVDAPSLLLSAGNAVGLDLSIDVSAVDEQADGGLILDGLRLGQYFLRVTDSTTCGGLPFCNSGAFCTPMLIP